MAKSTKEPQKSNNKKTTNNVKKIVKNKEDDLSPSTKISKKISTDTPKKTQVKKSNSKKSVSVKKEKSKSNSKSKTTKASTSNTIDILEYYDLPYRYNQTIVKILAQTPNILFVYWDISDDDRKKYEEQFGSDFFNTTRPILVVHNITKNNTFEVTINDFANSWYLKIPDANCKYHIELGRRPIAHQNDYYYITSSNLLDTPNDHILLENIKPGNTIYFKNIKNKKISSKELGSISFIPDIKKITKFYHEIYKQEILNEVKPNKISTPSSSYFY